MKKFKISHIDQETKSGYLRAMDKKEIILQIISKLEEDYQLFMIAAKTAHEAATHSENIPDNKYDTLALESSYIAQGQANRAQDIKSAIALLKQLPLKTFSEHDSIRLTAVVELEEENGSTRHLFLAPAAGGLTVSFQAVNIRVVTPESPLGKALLGCQVGDIVQLSPQDKESEIITVW